MTTKPSPLSNSSQPPVDNHTAARPAKGFKQVASRIANSFKGFGPRNDMLAKAPAAKELGKPSNNATSQTLSPQMLAEAREQADNFILRMSSSAAVDRVFATSKFPLVDEYQLKLLEARQLILDTEIEIQNNRAKLNASSTSDLESRLQIRFEVLKLGKILEDARALKTDYAARLNKACSSEIEKIQKRVDKYERELESSSGARQTNLQRYITEALFDMSDLRVVRDRSN